MRSHHAHTQHRSLPHLQRGAVLLVMLVIMIMGVMAVLVGELSKASLQINRSNKSSDLLAQSKEVVIGNIVAGIGGQRPGDSLRPDSFSSTESPSDYDGTPETGCLNVTQPGGLPLTTNVANMRCLGRLPWKAYGLPIEAPSENDPTGFMPWYAVSTNLLDPTGVIFNSELLNTAPHPWLTVRDMNGNVLSNRVAFVIIIPGAPINGQSRPSSPNLGGANQYLDSITVPAGCVAPCVPGTYSNADADDSFIMGEEHRWISDPANPGKQIEDTSYNFNDKLLYVTIDELMPLIEKRIAREAKKCLDDYAISSGGKYPWASLVTDTTYATTPNTFFGRIPNTPVFLVSNPTLAGALNNLQSALGNLQLAVNSCNISDTFSNRSNLTNAGAALLTAVSQMSVPPFTSSSSLTSLVNASTTAGNAAIPLVLGGSTYSSPCSHIRNNFSSVVESRLNNISSNNYLADITTTVPEDTSMQASWPSGCFVPGSYWDDWRNLVFYQVANGYQPNGSLSCTPNTTCITISGSGNTNSGTGTYRASIALAGKMKNGQTSRNVTVVSDYLESSNQANKTIAMPAPLFETYKLTDPSYSTVNDLALCLDGKINCK